MATDLLQASTGLDLVNQPVEQVQAVITVDGTPDIVAGEIWVADTGPLLYQESHQAGNQGLEADDGLSGHYWTLCAAQPSPNLAVCRQILSDSE